RLQARRLDRLPQQLRLTVPRRATGAARPPARQAGRVRATLVVDGNNVVGAAADGWWRDRPAAVRRLLGRLRCYGRGRPERIVLVLDVRQADLPEGTHDGIDVRYPDRPGRDAADGRIVELLEELAAGDPAP